MRRNTVVPLPRHVATVCCALLGLWLGPASSADAQAIGQGLMQSKACIACHQVDAKRVGPAFRVIAQRFEGADGAVDYLANSIRKGSRGRWGAVPMPAQVQVTDAEAHQLARWILSLVGDDAGGTRSP